MALMYLIRADGEEDEVAHPRDPEAPVVAATGLVLGLVIDDYLCHFDHGRGFTVPKLSLPPK
eukprot:scaffold108108_cov55-Phaeocystis_antarctica.AAC.1